jgi:broad specificity phosphatase PhoE
MMSQMLYLVRHCQAIGQEPTAPLTELGQQQAIELADWLDENHTSHNRYTWQLNDINFEIF